MTATQPDAARLFAFLSALPSRPDAGRCRTALGRAFASHRHEIGLPADEAWCFDHPDEILGTMASLFAQAAGSEDDDQPPALDWLGKMAWLIELVGDLEAGRARLDA